MKLNLSQGQGEVPGRGAVADQRVQPGEGGQAVFFVADVVVALADVRQARFGEPGARGVAHEQVAIDAGGVGQVAAFFGAVFAVFNDLGGHQAQRAAHEPLRVHAAHDVEFDAARALFAAHGPAGEVVGVGAVET